MIQIGALTDDMRTIKTAIEKIAREAQSQQPVSGQEDKVYIAAAPAVADIKEGQIVPMFDGVNYRIYTKLNGVIKYMALT